MGQQRLVLDVNYRALGDNVHGIGVHRASLFHWLFAQCEKRSVETDVEVTEVSRAKDGWYAKAFAATMGSFRSYRGCFR